MRNRVLETSKPLVAEKVIVLFIECICIRKITTRYSDLLPVFNNLDSTIPRLFVTIIE